MSANDLADLKRLKEVWSGLKEVVLKCHAARKVGGEDEDHYDELLNEARVLYGRLQRIIGTAAIQQAGRTFDAFQHVLGQPSIYSIIHDQFDAYMWQQLWSGGDSAIGQAIGRVEAKLSQSHPVVTSEVVARWSWLLKLLEGIRSCTSRLLARPKFVEPLLQSIEDSWLYRVAAVVTTFAAFLTLTVVCMTAVVLLVLRFVL